MFLIMCRDPKTALISTNSLNINAEYLAVEPLIFAKFGESESQFSVLSKCSSGKIYQVIKIIRIYILNYLVKLRCCVYFRFNALTPNADGQSVNTNRALFITVKILLTRITIVIEDVSFYLLISNLF